MVKFLSHVQIQHQDESALIEARRREQAEREKLAFQHAAASAMAEEALAEDAAPRQPEPPQTFTREQPKVGRKEPCPCGSGKKYKQCHGRIE